MPYGHISQAGGGDDRSAQRVGRPKTARRFIEEAQLGGQLQHPGVVFVYAIDRLPKRPFFTRRLIKG
jgi:hypothetical protein